MFWLGFLTATIVVSLVWRYLIEWPREGEVLATILRAGGVEVPSGYVGNKHGQLVYAVLRRLEKRGILTSTQVPGQPFDRRGGRARYYYSISPKLRPSAPP